MSKILIDETTVKLVLEALHVLLTEPSTFMAANKAESLLLQAAPVLRKALAEQPAQQEPFGYFKAEPFGWTDCAETDDGSIALFTTPQAQPAREPLTAKEIAEFVGTHEYGPEQLKWFRLGEAAHGIKDNQS